MVVSITEYAWNIYQFYFLSKRLLLIGSSSKFNVIRLITTWLQSKNKISFISSLKWISSMLPISHPTCHKWKGLFRKDFVFFNDLFVCIYILTVFISLSNIQKIKIIALVIKCLNSVKSWKYLAQSSHKVKKFPRLQNNI